MSSPVVDVIIAVHTATRPIARAVASVIDHTEAPVRVNVVAHNIAPDIIRTNLGAYADHPDVRLLPYRDGIPSPAGPMNHGLDQATAPFTALLGSDDEFAPGAIDSWLNIQQQASADAVLAQIRLPNGNIDPYPPVRNGVRVRELDVRKDRLFYRSAPLGLVSRERFKELRLAVGLRSGEDLPYSATVWACAHRLAYDLDHPGYIINDDVPDRVTFEPRPMSEDFRYLDEFDKLDWLTGASTATRTALVVKILRIHVFDAIAARISVPATRSTLAEDITQVLRRLHDMAPGAIRLLARADRRVLDTVLADRASEREISELLAARWTYRSINAMLPRNPLLALHRQAPFRTLLAGARSVLGR
ncbi:hypothetical protein GCM10027421_04790 [Microbacterium shaanxiense]